MKKNDLVYTALVAGVFAALTVWRRDLFIQAWHVSAAQMAAGGASRWHLLGEAALFAAILAFTIWIIPRRARPGHDAAVLAAGLAAGWLAECWGTRLGLWSYYTSEQPPLWVVPAWGLGCLAVERTAQTLQERCLGRIRSRALELGYWVLAVSAMLYCAAFSWPWRGQAGTMAAWLVLAGALFWRPRPGSDFWPLATGIVCVSAADLWGTTNGCWRYYVQDGSVRGLGLGIGFGMVFDASLVLGCLKLVRKI